ncbi:FtsX-like permease family protein [Fontivita pretiosa]|uniref:FtsX-like permease family protein n=1 Tax=Fontivita pretiosa TaxID=2989684 RepID=UPI003D17554E
MRCVSCCLALVLSLTLIGSAQAQIDDAQFRRDLEAIASHTSRIVGSDGYYRAADYVESQIRSLPQVQLQRHEFPIMVPVTEQATLTLPDGTAERVYPFWPASVRVNATPAAGIRGRLVYCGTATPEEIPPADVLGQIAVVESSAADRWTQAAYFGARAILILGREQTNHHELRSHDLLLPVNLPRFYVPQGPLAERLRKSLIDGEATLRAKVTWQRKTAINFYAYVPPRVKLIEGWEPKVPPAALMIAVPYDSSSLVPDLSPGASQAVQAAAGLALLRDLASHPLDRPVVIYFSGGDSIQFIATRNMLLALGEAPARWRQELKSLAEARAVAERDLHRARQVASEPWQLDIVRDRKLIDRIVKIIETDSALEQDVLFRLRMKSPEQRDPDADAQEKRLTDRQVLLSRIKYAFSQRPADLAQPEMIDHARQYVARTIQRLGGGADDRGGHVSGLVEQYDDRAAQLRRRIELYEWLTSCVGRNPNPSERENNQRPIELLVGLDLSDNGVRAGPVFFGQYQRTSNITDIQDYRDWFSKVDRGFARKEPASEWFGQVRQVIDFEPLNQSRSPQSFIASPLPIVSEMAPVWGVPGMTFITLDDLRLLRDTPNDTLDRLNVQAIVPQLHGVREVLCRAWNDPKFRGPLELKRNRNTVRGQVVSPSSGRPVPDLPRDGFLATYYYVTGVSRKIPQFRGIPWTLGIRRNEVRDCDAEGNYIFEGLTRIDANYARDYLYLAVEVFRIDPDSGAITASTDLGKQAGDIKLYADLRQDLNPMRSLVFNCEEFTLAGVYDPRFLQALGDVIILDARRNAEPQRYNVTIHNQLLAGFIEPGSRVYLPIRYGRVGNRLLLLNMPPPADTPAEPRGSPSPGTPAEPRSAPSPGTPAEARSAHSPGAPAEARSSPSPGTPGEGRGEGSVSNTHNPPTAQRSPGQNPQPDYRHRSSRGAAVRGEGLGFTAEQLNNLGPLSLVTSRDFWRLDELRLSQYRKAGVSSSLLDDLHARSAEQIRLAEAAHAANQGAELIRHANGAWANEARVYSAAQEMARDVIRAAIFLLLLCVPFAFCMERLLIGTPNVYKQIAGICVIFAIMTAVLWSFHPAFKISASPLIIILAFAIIFMSIVVISVVYGKFDTELKRIRSGRGSATIASFARASVLLSAVLLGIANMRRRRFRTALTSITIVLITFAVLCFTSAARYLDTTTLPAGVQTSHFGVMLRQRGFRQMPPAVVQSLRPVIANTVGDRRIVERWWNVNAGDPREMINIVAGGHHDGNPPRVAAVAAVLGLSPGESELSKIDEVIGESFQRLENGETQIVYLSRTTAEQIGVKVGDRVDVGGIELSVAGIYDSEEFDHNVFMLSGEPLAPLKYSSGALDAGGRRLDDTAVESLDLDAESTAAELGGTYEHLPSSQFVIVPSSISRMIHNASLRSVGIRLDSEQQVKALADELAKRYALALFAGFSDGVQMVAASNLASVSGAGQVAIPLAIAGLIIFNTMMGSIAERRREIHVYTSLGLAPMHVGALFVAEAMTYGLLGTVFGYIIGQGAGTVLLKMGWLGNVTLNYSGTSAMLTMGLILIIVLLSALVPARLASKIAAPSIERTWRVPMPKGDEIIAQLPFTINRTAAEGALAYLAEFFDAHQEGSIGKFSAGKVETFTFEDEQHRLSRGLKTVVWLTPFDLGVRQHVMLLIHPGQFPDIYEVQVILQRLSGDDGSWYRMNRTFLTELRKQFLQWRSLTPQRMLEYVEESRKLFAQAPPQELVPAVAGGAVGTG